MGRAFATNSSSHPDAWHQYLANGDHAALAGALDLDADAYSTTIADKGDVKAEQTQTKANPAELAKGEEEEEALQMKQGSPLANREATIKAMAAELAKRASIDIKSAAIAVDLLLNPGSMTLKKGDKISLVGFGSFSISERSARTGRNPQTGKEIKIAAKTVVKFKAGADLSRKVN